MWTLTLICVNLVWTAYRRAVCYRDSSLRRFSSLCRNAPFHAYLLRRSLSSSHYHLINHSRCLPLHRSLDADAPLFSRCIPAHYRAPRYRCAMPYSVHNMLSIPGIRKHERLRLTGDVTRQAQHKQNSRLPDAYSRGNLAAMLATT